MQLRLRYYDDPILRKKGCAVKNFDEFLRERVEQMIAIMREADGIGLAAQQVGLAEQLFVMDLSSAHISDFWYRIDGRQPPLSLIMPMAVCNPEITRIDDETEESEEGCLSFPGLSIPAIQRDASIRLRFQDPEGNSHQLEADGLLARCIQHEYDHLQGVLFIDRVPRNIRRQHAKEIEKIKATYS